MTFCFKSHNYRVTCQAGDKEYESWKGVREEGIRKKAREGGGGIIIRGRTGYCYLRC